MKIASIAHEPQELLSPVEQAAQHRSSLESGERTEFSLGQSQRSTADADDSEEISLQKLQNLTEAVDSYMSSLGVNLKFSVDEQTDIVQVEVRDPETDKLIRKIPGDEMLDLAASIENMVGLFLNKAL